MILTVYTAEDERLSFLDVKEFVVAGPMEIAGTSEVDFDKQGFRFVDNSVGGVDRKEIENE